MRTAATCAGMIAAPAVAASDFAPGRRQHQTQLITADVPGVPQWLIKLMARRGSRTSCNSAEQPDRHPEEHLKGDDTAICRSPQLSKSNGKLVYDTFCTNKHFPNGLLVSSHGTYTPTSYAISTISTGTKDGKPVRISTAGSGKRVSATCSSS